MTTTVHNTHTRTHTWWREAAHRCCGARRIANDRGMRSFRTQSQDHEVVSAEAKHSESPIGFFSKNPGYINLYEH